MRHTIAVVLLILLTLGLMYFMLSGWQSRGKKIPLEELPPLPPGDWREREGTRGIYVSTTLAGLRFERVVSQGLGVKAAAVVHVLPDGPHAGVVVLRQGAADLYIPLAAMKETGLTSGMVGKFAGPESILVIRWVAGSVPVDTGIHIRSPQERADLLAQVSALFAPAQRPTTDEDE